MLPGTYAVRAEAKGFKIIERQNVLLEARDEARVDLQLQPGGVNEQIIISDAIPLAETNSAEMSVALGSPEISNIPLNGRNFVNLVQLRPGVAAYPGLGSSWYQSANGMRPHDNLYLIQGVYNDDPWTAQPMLNATLAEGDAGTILSLDSIDEVKIEQDFRAEDGWKPGATVNVGIKAGTNLLHGTAFAFGRDSAWDAANYFASALPPTQRKPPVALEQFGGTVGGPIRKDKAFYFLSFEDQRYSIGSVSTVTTPVTSPGIGNSRNNLLLACQAALDVGTPAEATSGSFGALTALSAQIAGITVGPPSSGHPNGMCAPGSNYPGLFPVNPGTNATGSVVTSISESLTDKNQIDAGLAKVTYFLSERNSLNGMYLISPGGGTFNDEPGIQTNPAWLTSQYGRAQLLAANWTWTPQTGWVNEARVGYSRYYQAFLSQDHNDNPANYDFNGNTYHLYTGQTDPLYWGFPVISIRKFTGELGTSWPKYLMPDSVLDLVDHFSYLRGKHAFKFGGEVLDNRSASLSSSAAKGPIHFDQLQDFFNGFPDGPPGCTAGIVLEHGAPCPGGGGAALLVGNLLRHFSFQDFAAFLQDDWRVKPRLMVNLGIRYELNEVPKERNDLQGNFAPNTFSGFVQSAPGEPGPYSGDHNNLSPRIGFAWDILGGGRAVLRGGGGVIYEQLSLDVAAGIGNTFGLRAAPTGALLCGNGTCIPGPGTISVANLNYSGTPVVDGTAPGDIPFTWAHNSQTTPLYTFVAACGDGKTTSPALPSGFEPTQCNAFFVDPNLRTPYVSNWNLDLQWSPANNLVVDVGYVGNHGTKFLGMLDINQPVATTANVPGVGVTTFGPGYTAVGLGACAAAPSLANCAVDPSGEQAARPYNSKYPYLGFIDKMGNFDNSSYNGLQAVIKSRAYRGVTVTVGYTYSHAFGEGSDQGLGGGNFLPINSYGSRSRQLNGPTSFDVRHRLTIAGSYAPPGRKGWGQMLEGWSINTVAVIQTGMPWYVSDATTDFAGTGEINGNPAATQGGQWNFFGNPKDFTPVHNFANINPAAGGYTVCDDVTITSDCVAPTPGIPYFPGSTDLSNSPTANRTCNEKAAGLGPLALASLRLLGCYGLGNSVLIPPPYGGYGETQWNQFYDQGFRNWDFSVTKSFLINERLTAQFRVEFFNILNHPDFGNPSGGPAGGNAEVDPSFAGQDTGLGVVSATPDVASGNPVLGSGGPREVQLGLKLVF